MSASFKLWIINSKCWSCWNSRNIWSFEVRIWHFIDVVEKGVTFWPTPRIVRSRVRRKRCSGISRNCMQQQRHQALLKAKYCPRVAAALCTQKNTKKLMWPWSLTYVLEILWVSGGCQNTCLCKISSSCVQRFLSYRGHSEKKLRRKQYSPSQPGGQ